MDPKNDDSLYTQFNTYLGLLKQNKLSYSGNPLHELLNATFQEIESKRELSTSVKQYRVLIILGDDITSCNITPSLLYYQNSSTVSVAFLYKHLFKYLYGFDDKQILITNISSKFFMSTNSDSTFEQSPKRTRYYDPTETIETKDNSDETYYSNVNLDSFLHHNLCVTQVFNSEYLFPVKNQITEIKPFNRKSLQSLNVNTETELFIFFLNHGFENEFSLELLEYQYFVERIIELNSKKNYFFIDCCYSGSFIKILNTSVQLIEIFPKTKEESDKMYNIRLQALAKILSQWEDFGTLTVDEIITKISLEGDEIGPQLKQDHQKISSTEFQKDHHDFISTMFTFKKTNIVPHHFAQLKRNSIIFCSSTNSVESFALPERFYLLPSSQKICSFGSYFSSIILSFFFKSLPNFKTQSKRFFCLSTSYFYR